MPPKETAPEVAPKETAPEVAVPVNHNVTYREVRLEVKSVMRPDGNGGEKLRRYEAEILKTVKTISVEPRHAKRFNDVWHTRMLFYVPVDKEMPLKMKRTPIEDENDNPIWKDEMIYAPKEEPSK